MLTDAASNVFSSIYVCAGRTDLRKGMEGLAWTLTSKYGINPYQENTLFLFRGNASYKIKGLLWERNGFVLVQKRLKDTRFRWPTDESKGLILISYESYIQLMNEGSIE